MYLNTIEQDIESALQKLNLKNKFSIVKSDYDDFDYQTSLLFQFSKDEKQKHFKEIIIEHLINSGNYQDVKVTGKNFLSFKIKPQAYIIPVKSNQHVIIDYCGINVAKQMHIGHIRSMFIGDYISKSHEFIGDKVTRINHIGDWGNQFGFLLLYIFKNKLPIQNNKQLTDYYKKSYQLYNEDKMFALEAVNTVTKLQNKQEPFYSLWKNCCEISINEMNKTTEEFQLSICSSDIQGESFYFDMLPSIEKMLIEKKIAILQDDGTLISNFKKLPTILLKKSSGSYLYAMYDIAAIYWRINELNPDKIVYVVDKRQELHFKQVFEIAHLMGWDIQCKLEHIGFGFILNKENQPLKTKSGTSMYLDEFILQGFNEIEKYPYYENLEGDYKKIVIDNTLYGSLKIFDLHSNYKTDYQFDWDNILNAKGGTAPYIQNAYVRIDSILFKENAYLKYHELLNFNFIDYSLLSKHGEKLLKQSVKCIESIYTTMDNYGCHILEENLINLCKNFHHFYELENISQSKNKKNQLVLLIHVKNTIEIVCNIFGVKTYLSQSHFNNN